MEKTEAEMLIRVLDDAESALEHAQVFAPTMQMGQLTVFEFTRKIDVSLAGIRHSRAEIQQDLNKDDEPHRSRFRSAARDTDALDGLDDPTGKDFDGDDPEGKDYLDVPAFLRRNRDGR